MLSENQTKLIDTIIQRAKVISDEHEGEEGYFEGSCPQMSDDDLIVVRAYLPVGISLEGDEIVVYLG